MRRNWTLAAIAAGSLLLGVVGGVSASPDRDCDRDGRPVDGYRVYPTRWGDSNDRYRRDYRYDRDYRYGRDGRDDWRYRRARLREEREEREERRERERWRLQREREERREWRDRDRDRGRWGRDYDRRRSGERRVGKDGG